MYVTYGNILDNASEFFSVKDAREEAAASGERTAVKATAIAINKKAAEDTAKVMAAVKDLEAADVKATAGKIDAGDANVTVVPAA